MDCRRPQLGCGGFFAPGFHHRRTNLPRLPIPCRLISVATPSRNPPRPCAPSWPPPPSATMSSATTPPSNYSKLASPNCSARKPPSSHPRAPWPINSPSAPSLTQATKSSSTPTPTSTTTKQAAPPHCPAFPAAASPASAASSPPPTSKPLSGRPISTSRLQNRLRRKYPQPWRRQHLAHPSAPGNRNRLSPPRPQTPPRRRSSLERIFRHRHPRTRIRSPLRHRQRLLL